MIQKKFALRRLVSHPVCMCIALAPSGAVLAQSVSPVLPEVQVEASSASDSALNATEGTGQYTSSGTSKVSTPLGLSIRETPQSLTVFTSQQMEDQKMQNITDVLNQATGIFVNRYETHRGQFTARGFDLNTLMIDGVPTTWDQAWSSGELFSSLAMYDRVEVVRGSTGLTSGTGDPSASVNLVRKRAMSDVLTGSVELDIGNWSQRRALFDISTPLNEARTVRARIVGEHSQADSWVDLLRNKSQTIFATVEADLTSSTMLRAGLSRQKTSPQGTMWGGLPAWYDDGSSTDWSRSKTTSADWTRWDTSYQTYFAGLEQKMGEGWKLDINYARGNREADSRLLYLMGSPNASSGLGMYAWPGSYKVNTEQDDFSVQAAGPFQLFGRKHDLSLGYSYSKQRFNSDSRSAQGTMAPDFNNWDASWQEPVWGSLSYYGSSVTEQQSAYLASRWGLTDHLRIILGARLTNYRKSGDDIFASVYSIRHNSEFTPYAGVVYDLNDSLSLYASYTDIFKPQKERDINGRYLDPILGKSIETGIKGEFFDGKLNASAAVFQIRQNNLAQATTETIPGLGGVPETAYRATQGAKSKGAEIEVTGQLKPGWNLSAGYTQFSVRDAEGKQVNTMNPRKMLRLFSTYRLNGSLNALTLGAGLTWQSATYTTAENPLKQMKRINEPSYALFNLMARYEFSPQLSAQLNINNVFDKSYRAFFSATSQYTYGAPRSVLLSAKYTF